MNFRKQVGLLLIVLGSLCLVAVGLRTPALASPDAAANPSAGSQTTAFLPAILTSNSTENIQQAGGFIQHAGRLMEYTGAATCAECHEAEVHEFAASNHYQWEGKFGSINDFCGFPDINFGPGKLTTVQGTQIDGGCATCHAGMGERPTADNEENADCLICHATQYRRTLVNVDGAWRFVPNREAMPATITIQEEPTRESCLACHAYAGGGCNNKRGDMSDALVNPSPSQDVHMGNGMTCVDCHLTENHQIAGRGTDLRIDEGVPMRACTDCHKPESDHNEWERAHLDKVACQSCHIPEFARAVSTDMHRDFRLAEVNPKGLYEPVIERGSNVIPEYAFWNGGSGFYEFRAPAVPGQLLAWPLGNINDGLLYPFKLHLAIQPIDLLTQAILPVKSGILFQTGDMDRSIRVGAAESGFDLSQGYGFQETGRYMGIFHEMPPAKMALECSDCHEATNRIDFAALGYTPNTTRNGEPLCQSCHEQPEEGMSFYKLHEKHVKDKRIACDQCHSFSRSGTGWGGGGDEDD